MVPLHLIETNYGTISITLRHLSSSEAVIKLPFFEGNSNFLVNIDINFEVLRLNYFKRGRTNLTDDVREGRSSTVMTEHNISAVRLMIETDKKVTYQQIWISLGIGQFVETLWNVSCQDWQLDLSSNRFTNSEGVSGGCRSETV
ncbi:hypothetical protein EVAR_29894_1 [Eumeta japonica]|uniref:Uncharacterized protein n=1 Tax=Eumeta variegata TaxID=151549 RepID=A0A4C1V764_EUMVA|nr:hypothetical protein EVAR_29894_1 [Eumeta japonica]